MMFLLVAIALTAFAAPLLRVANAAHGRISASGFDGTGVVIGFVVTALVATVTTPLMGFGFIIAVLIHEFGAALACQIVGQEVSRVRLVPLPFVAPPRTDRTFDNALDESFTALYGPALSILPMLIAFGLEYATAPYFAAVSEMFKAIAIMIGTFNFVMLLPFLPFPGGRVIKAVSESFWPHLSIFVTVFMTAAFASAALRDYSIAMMILAAAGLQSLFHRKRHKQARLTPNQSVLVLASYAFTLTVHFIAGWSMLPTAM